MADAGTRSVPWYAHVMLLGAPVVYGLSQWLPGWLGCSEYTTAQSELCNTMESTLDLDLLWVAGRIGLFAMVLSIVTVPLVSCPRNKLQFSGVDWRAGQGACSPPWSLQGKRKQRSSSAPIGPPCGSPCVRPLLRCARLA